ncbi:MAG: HD domain-containing protein [Lachnospiraceae bacterium]|nr:HD domain-containing protein [Lachnospiraceae bacterium]
MIEFLREHQLNIMLILCGLTGGIAYFAWLTTSMSKKRRIALVLMELEAFLLLFFDRFAYIYRGDVSRLGYWMVRISNFTVFLMSILVIASFNRYLRDFLMHEGGLMEIPKRLKIVDILVSCGVCLLILSRFFNFYYTFDETNHYIRSRWFLLSYLCPLGSLLLQLSVIVQYRKRLSVRMRTGLLLFSSIPILATIAQVFMYGLSLTNMTIVAMCVLLYVFALVEMNHTLERVHRQELEYLEEKQKSMSRLFEQTATALASAIDAGKTHVNGHSARVAEYARQIARLAGKSEADCERVYFAALLHDVGKIGVPDAIVEKDIERTQEEQALYENHALEGAKILSAITEYSYLSIGAHYHHERYDGLGYPERLKGNAIPEIARIIAVADGYDVMTSANAYRGPLPQSRVREEFVKEAGLKFDPAFSKIMLQMIDSDPNYRMKDTGEGTESQWKNELVCKEYRSEISAGFPVSENVTRMHILVRPLDTQPGAFSMPALILFDSLDARVHTTEQMIRENGYTEYGELWFDGHSICTRARELKVEMSENQDAGKSRHRMVIDRTGGGTLYELEIGKYKDHVRIRIHGGPRDIEAVAALPDTTRYTFIGLTGENCHLLDISTEDAGITLKEGDIPRIAEEIIYTGRMESDLKNVQIDGKRSAYTEAVEVYDAMCIEFHTMSLPTAELVWHCPYLVLFYSDNGKLDGPNYQEYVLIRLDGEIEEADEQTENKMLVTKNDSFESWDTWKSMNRRGMECSVTFRKKGNKVTVTTENAGISIKNTTTLTSQPKEVYVALTGDRCALTDIRIL